MRKKSWILLLILAVLVMGGLGVYQKPAFKKYFKVLDYNTLLPTPSEQVAAVFGFNPGRENKSLVHVDHYTINLSATARHFNVKALEAGEQNTPAMITVETWGDGIFRHFAPSPLSMILDGSYDTAIKSFAKRVEGTRSEVFLRFNPEMEVPVSLYPWQNNRDEYILAFRHFSKLCREQAPGLQVVWAPAGYPGCLEFYPGDGFADAASVTLKSNSEMPLNVYPKDYPLEYDVFRRLHRLRFIDLPIFVLTSKNEKHHIDARTVHNIRGIFKEEQNTAYSPENFSRPGDKPSDSTSNSFEIGFYDPNDLLVNEPEVTAEHLFADFGNLSDGSFEKRFQQVLARGHHLIVTFEPFRHPLRGDDRNVLEDISGGQYDTEIDQFFRILLSTENTIYLRYAHEMEIPITRYPWQSQNPLTYIKSFRYFMTRPDSLPPNIKRVWGPAGDRGSIEWWPGNDVVDYVSIAVYGLPDKNITDPMQQESFATIFNRKQNRMRFIDKPMFITEFGVKGPEDYQTSWLVNAARTIRENPQIKGVNYFNMTDTPKAWGDIKPPDWSISKASFHNFLAILQGED